MREKPYPIHDMSTATEAALGAQSRINVIYQGGLDDVLRHNFPDYDISLVRVASVINILDLFNSCYLKDLRIIDNTIESPPFNFDNVDRTFSSLIEQNNQRVRNIINYLDTPRISPDTTLRVDRLSRVTDILNYFNTSKGNLNEMFGTNWMSNISNWIITSIDDIREPQPSNIGNIDIYHPELQRTTPKSQGKGKEGN